MKTGDGAVPLPKIEVVPNGAAGREIGRDGIPLAPGREHVEDRVQDLADIDRPRSTPSLGGADERPDQLPFGIGQIARVAKSPTIGGTTMIPCPHARCPPTTP